MNKVLIGLVMFVGALLGSLSGEYVKATRGGGIVDPPPLSVHCRGDVGCLFCHFEEGGSNAKPN